MIEVIEHKKSGKKQDPYYKLVFNYMIGDANGNTTEETIVPIEDAEIVEKFVTVVNRLSPTEGYWGVILETDRIPNHLDEGQITQEEYDFLMKVMFGNYDEDFEGDDELDGYFAESVRAEAEYSFLVFQGVDLYYYDEYGSKHKTRIK